MVTKFFLNLFSQSTQHKEDIEEMISDDDIQF